MKRILFCMFVFCSGSLAAQTFPPSVTRIYPEEQGNNVAFRVQNKVYPGTETVFLKLEKLQNCKTPARTTVHEIRSDGETLLILRPVDESAGVGFNFEYTIFTGRIDPKVDTAFVCRIPCSPLSLVQVRYAIDVLNYAKQKNNIDSLGIYFDLEKGDTVYAARRGVVTEIKREGHYSRATNIRYTSQSTSVNVEHADGSFAWYICLDADHVFVREGDTVFPDTPLALVGSYDDEEYNVSLQFFWYTANPDKAAREKLPYVPRPFFPPFATTDGAAVLTHGDIYTPEVNGELIMREMTKKEQKWFLGNKK